MEHRRIEAEREGWKKHFETISGTQGSVNDRVWDNIPITGKMAEWMDLTPMELEIDECIRKMKGNRQPGEDGLVAEALKYGGTKLRLEVYKIVKNMFVVCVVLTVSNVFCSGFHAF